MKRFLLLAMFVAGLILIAKPQRIIDLPGHPSERMAKLWNKDIENLKKAKTFPAEDELQKINFIPANPLARTWLLKTKPNLYARGQKKGKYFLEVTLMAWAQKDHGLVVQYELFEGKKRNKAWEFARTFTF